MKSAAPSPQSARDILSSIFGYENFRGHQAEIIDTIAKGSNALVLMSTGAGKSLCYQIPALMRAGTGIVISPLIALMQNQVMALQQYGVRAEFLNSTMRYDEVKDVEKRFRAGKLDLLYIAPERLLMPTCLSMLKEVPIALFAIDEAHCVSQWGHDFRPEYQQLSVLSEHFPNVPRIALTATADNITRSEIIKQLKLDDASIFVSGFDRPNIRYRIVEKDNPKKQLLAFIKEEHATDSGIVYCLSRKSVEEVCLWLNGQGIAALKYHAGMSKDARDNNQTRFIHEEGVVMVATIAFGMGIDKPNVRFVAHLDMPKSIEAYYQETGRAGRDGLPAQAWLTYGLQDVIIHRHMSEEGSAGDAIKRIEQRKLDALLGLCESTSCRRHTLLEYFGEPANPKCNNCDNCLVPQELWDGTKAAQMALSSIYRTKEMFGVNHLIDVLLGKETEKVSNFGHHRLSVFGVGKLLSPPAWRSIFRQLIAMRYIRVEMEAYGALKLTPSCSALLRSEQPLYLRKLAEKQKRSRKEGRVGVGATVTTTTVIHGDLYLALKAVRLSIAKENSVPPYVIFHDRTLMEIAEKLPRTANDFRMLYGVGEQKLSKYSQPFIDAVLEFERT